jgi:simple sugar transport system substrate-binding protein
LRDGRERSPALNTLSGKLHGPRTTRRRAFALAASVTATLAAVAAVTASTAGARSSAATAGKWCTGVHIRFFDGGDPGDSFATIVLNGAKQAQADLGPKVDYVFSGWNVERMVSQLRDAIAAHPDGIAMMGHPGDTALMPLAKQAKAKHIFMEYQNVDVPKVRATYGGGYVGANLTPQGQALGVAAIKQFGLKSGDEAIVFGAWGQPGRYFREQGTVDALAKAGIKVQKIVSPTESGSDPNVLTPLVSAAVLKAPKTKLIVYAGGQQLGAASTYMQAINKKPGEIKNIGFDLSPAVLNGFQTGYVQLTSDQLPYLQGYLPILSLCMQAKYGMAPITQDTSSGLVDGTNYHTVAALVKRGVR